jgi:hypothetical protein
VASATGTIIHGQHLISGAVEILAVGILDLLGAAAGRVMEFLAVFGIL